MSAELNDTLRQSIAHEDHILSLQEDRDAAWKVLALATEAYFKANQIYNESERALWDAKVRREGKPNV